MKTSEWYQTTNFQSLALAAEVIPTSNKAATSPDKISFWQLGIDKEHACLTKCKTWELFDLESGINILPCKYLVKVKDYKPKVRLVAL